MEKKGEVREEERLRVELDRYQNETVTVLTSVKIGKTVV